MTGLVWETPPEPTTGRRPGAVKEIVAQLKDRPGEWALVSADAPLSNGTRLRKAGCEVRSKWVGPGPTRYSLWARWPVIP